jgi:CHAT domain-containing protein/tetratricopeptide (TPR) repeat protein
LTTVQTPDVLDGAGTARQELLQQLPHLRRRSAQIKFIGDHPELLTAETVIWLSDSSRDQAKIDAARALPLAELAMAVAGKLKDRSARARSMRAMGNALYASGQNKAAAVYHEKGRLMFEKAGNRREEARTLSASIQPLILTGRYERALASAKKARRIFASRKDAWRLARLDLNTGNIFHRQDRFAEALKWYQRAHRYFFMDPEKDPEAMGVALHNIAMCKVSLNDFHGAFSAHQEARTFAEKHGMHILVVQSDYNIAALHYLRGEHSRAMRMLLDTLEVCKTTQDHYHAALCRLDLSEIYLQLNLAEPAEEMAREASTDFQKLEMSYETGKSLVNLALAMARQNKPEPALQMLVKARRRFVSEKNFAWPFLTDFYQAIILTGQGRHRLAWTRCLAANRFFLAANLPDKLVLTYLLLAQLQLRMGNPASAAQTCSSALAVLAETELPVLACQAQQLMGRIHAAAGNTSEAYRCYQAARRLLEAMRSDLLGDELKISFMQDKLEIYEGLVQLCLDPKSEHHSIADAFEYIERSKSRSLQDLISLTEVADPSPARLSKAQQRAIDLRAEINWYSHKLAAAQLRSSQSAPKLLNALHSAIQKREKELLRLAREIPPAEAESAGLSSSDAATLQEIRAALPAGSTLLEYFQIRDQLLAAVVTSGGLNIVPVTQLGELTPLLEHLEYQLAKFRLGAEYVKTFGDSLLKATQHHLKDLYGKLISPLEELLEGQHLVVVPHGLLHRLPFQALYDGHRYLIDRFSISYAPSATIYSLCRDRPVNDHGGALVMGIPDAAAPLILDEATAVAGIIPKAELLLSGEVTMAALKEKGSRCRLIHIATHGYHRQDSPMFSGIRLGDSILSLYDLYRFNLPAELITLSGCATGVSTVAGGDELLGLVRGLIRAGARAALLTLWDVQDRSTLEFMTSFYRHFTANANKAAALQKAVQTIREHYPHPYYWAPFGLVGNVSK